MSKAREIRLPKTVRTQRQKIKQRLLRVMDSRSQRGWAKELGIPQQNISRYLAGGTPHIDFLIHLARKEGVNLNWLVLGEGRRFRG